MASLSHPHQVYGFSIPNGLEIPTGDFSPQSNHSPNDSHLKRNGLSFSAAISHQHHHQSMMHGAQMQAAVQGGPGQDGHIKRCVDFFFIREFLLKIIFY